MGNIKRIIGIGLALCSLFSLSSCLEMNERGTDSQVYSSETSGTSDTEGRLNGYENIKCKTSKQISIRYFSFGDGGCKVLSLPLPIEWTFKESTNGYDILCENVKIGTIKSGNASLGADEKNCDSDSFVYDMFDLSWNLISCGGEFIHRFVYTCTLNGIDRAITLEVGYAEIDDFGLNKVKYSTDIVTMRTESRLGTIDLSARAGEKPILILGNSFVGSSQVGSIFEQMCNAGTKNNYDVIWASQGMATVSKNWSEYKNGMRNGEYAAVFMCGFYSSGDVSAFRTFVDLCKASNTPLVIFPAHNERYGGTAAKKYPDVYYLDWKGELDALIDSGVSRWDLCFDDEYDHSNPLAGYVGAHMIYRALFGEMPPVLNTYYNIQHYTVVQKLGDYVQTGELDLTDDRIIYEIK